jgi:AraC-like DNA-binding protein
MKPVRKSFFEDPLFPFDIVYRDTKSPQSELPEHLHDRFELVYIYKGKGTFFINRTFYEMNAGDLFLIPGDTIHRSLPDESDPITSTAVFFAPALVQPDSLGDAYSSLHIFELARKRKHYKLETAAALREQTEAALQDIHEELQSRKTGYRHAVRLQLQQQLLRLNRLALSDASGSTADIQVGPVWMKQILQYIDHHHYEPGLGLSALADRVSVTAAHFSRVFKQLTGMNVTVYVNAKRIVRAKELLLGTNESVDRVAESCGFDSLPHFHRVFKVLTGLTPGAYRRQAAADSQAGLAGGAFPER